MSSLKLIITLPEHDLVTKYFSKWSIKIIDFAKKSGIHVIGLARDKANKKEVVGRIKKLQPNLVILNGHGNEECITGHENEPILTEGDKVFPTNVIYARSCRAGSSLAKNLVKNGVGAFIGYDQDFIIRLANDGLQKPLSNKVAELYMIPSNHVSIALLKGHTAEEANERSKELYRKSINKLLLEGPKSEFYEEIKYLYWDMIHQVCLGDLEAKIA